MAEVITDGSIESLEQYLDIDELPNPEAEPAPNDNPEPALWQEIIYSSGVKNLTLSVVLLVVVNAHTAVTLPAVGDHLGLAALHAAEPAQRALLDEV